MNFLCYMPMVPACDLHFRPDAAYRWMRIDPLEFYGEEEFRKRYRFSKETFRFLSCLLEDDIGNSTQRHGALSAADKLCIALRFYAACSMSEVVGDTLWPVSKSCVSEVVRDVSVALSRVCRIIGACAVLHNIACTRQEVNFFDEETLPQDDVNDYLVVNANPRVNRQAGQTYRQQIGQIFF